MGAVKAGHASVPYLGRKEAYGVTLETPTTASTNRMVIL